VDVVPSQKRFENPPLDLGPDPFPDGGVEFVAEDVLDFGEELGGVGGLQVDEALLDCRRARKIPCLAAI
jgi:hypothetical protein